ncbi:MAG: PaaI family thioesterase [Caulobacterales bacterium]|nr:PaaI family thioesterase [Caulobacterales bacterium]
MATDAGETGVVSREHVLSMSGRDYLQSFLDGQIPLAPISKTMGYALVEIGEGFAAFEGEPGVAVYNPLGWVHGGFAMTLIDSATGCAVHTELPAGVGYTSVETKVNFVRPITLDTGRVRAEGRLLNLGRSIALAEAHLRDPAGKLLAHGTSTCAIITR